MLNKEVDSANFGFRGEAQLPQATASLQFQLKLESQ